MTIDGNGADAFSGDVRGRRAAAGLTVRQVADRLADHGASIDPSGISRIENGQRMPRLDEALALAAVFGATLEEMVGPRALGAHESDSARLIRLTEEVAFLTRRVLGAEQHG